MAGDPPSLPVLLEAIVNGPIVAVKKEAGPKCCAYASTYLAEILTRFGYRSVALPVSVAIIRRVVLDRDEKAIARLQKTGGFSVFHLGAYDIDRLCPKPGKAIAGYATAGHVVTVVKGAPNLLLDSSLDQANKWADEGCPPCRPMYLKRLARYPLPGHQERYPLDGADNWVLQYDWLAEDPGVLKKLRRESAWYDAEADNLRSRLS